MKLDDLSACAVQLPSFFLSPVFINYSTTCAESVPLNSRSFCQDRTLRYLGSLNSSKRLFLALRETQVQSLGREDPLEKEIATHSSTHAWKIPWTEEPQELQSMGGSKESDRTEWLHFHLGVLVHLTSCCWYTAQQNLHLLNLHK